ncbi:hypothetical protein NC652_011120 [Populus alba x Populus x berolinensis]|nr:hypothetical protein NC652_011120 [Populus alba x Populus x berolinensis]
MSINFFSHWLSWNVSLAMGVLEPLVWIRAPGAGVFVGKVLFHSGFVYCVHSMIVFALVVVVCNDPSILFVLAVLSFGVFRRTTALIH